MYRGKSKFPISCQKIASLTLILEEVRDRKDHFLLRLLACVADSPFSNGYHSRRQELIKNKSHSLSVKCL